MLPEQDTELRTLWEKITDLEDSSRRKYVSFFSILEHKEGSDIKAFLKIFFPELMGLDFSPPLEFQRAHRIGPLHEATSGRPHPIIACFLCHDQARQVISTARSQGPYSLEGHEVREASDFSRVTNEKRKASLALQLQLTTLDIKFVLFEPAHMWIMYNGKSTDFTEPADLCSFLDDLAQHPMDHTPTLSRPDPPAMGDPPIRLSFLVPSSPRFTTARSNRRKAKSMLSKQ
ncbi:hypothetical protein NDU88_005374 [Pleurodeles waltl]|uniref:Uncharacterized protein n=1 Tax=Pleurodeles waltl TaxID=8319 RepID=A0AAV7UHX9_PLEWA|nr:hypothetical protein NDU88_005374 [Pleurodeles waltl]